MDSAKSGSIRNGKSNGNSGWPKGVLKPIVVLVAGYCVLIACWPVAGKAYSRFYCAGADLLFGSFGSSGVTRFRTSEDASCDVELFLCNTDRVDSSGKKAWTRCGCSSLRGGYMYAAFVTALIAATPISIRRKLWALVWGLILIHGFIALKLGVRIVDAFGSEPLGLFVMGPFWEKGFYILHALMVNVTFGFIVSIFVWILVTFRRGDWERIIATGGQGGKNVTP